MIYKIKTATIEEIRTHLLKCNDDFIPRLSEKVSIDVYATKIFKRSVTFEAWSGPILVGLIAVYFNDDVHKVGFITNVSLVKDCVGIGIASELMRKCICYAKRHNFKEIKLEVNMDNSPAIYLYKKFGFEIYGKKGSDELMKLMTPTPS